MEAADFAELAAPLHLRLVRAVFALTGDRDLAEDCTQDALVALWEAIDAGREITSPDAWTMSAAINLSRSTLRRRSAERRALRRVANRDRLPGVDLVDDDAQVPDHRSNRAVEAAVAALPEGQREVVVLHYLSQMPTPEIAQVTGRSQSAVRNSLFHARKSLAARLDEVGITIDSLEGTP